MDRAINDFIGRFPSRCSISHEELEKRHHSCRGRAMSQIDRMASIAENNSFTIFGQRSDEYPFTMGAGMAGPDEFWTRMDSLAFWTLEHLHEDSAGTSIRWLVEVDRSLDRLNAPARDYWCLHTASLLAPTEKDWLTWGKKTGPSIRSVLSRQNEETFSTFWNDSGASIPDFDVNGLIAAVMSETCLSLERRFRVLREINHLVLGQLGLLCKFEIPVVVHAWQRRLTL
ncbi:MAG: hypothetical protein JWM83_1924 [Candidatus Angelobacter sp.]|nr:hypothetical protein [Candidatus Angelobacter sp.]